MSPKVAIVIVNWNGWEFLQNCLSSVFDQAYPDYRVVFVDNCSADESIAFVKAKFPQADLLELAVNTGYPQGNNLGIKYALGKYDPDYVLLLNNDIKIPAKDCLASLVAEAESSEAIGVVGCKLVYPDGQVQDMGLKSTPQGYRKLVNMPGWSPPERPYAVDIIMGAVFLIKRSVIEKIGLLDEGFSPFYSEDTDYCARAHKAGFEIKVVPATKVIHYTGQTTKRLPTDCIKGIAKRGEIRFALLNYPISWLPGFAAAEAGNIVSQIFGRKDRTRRVSPWNIEIRPGWRGGAACLFGVYFHVLMSMGDIILKRFGRTRKLWY